MVHSPRARLVVSVQGYNNASKSNNLRNLLSGTRRAHLEQQAGADVVAPLSLMIQMLLGIR